VARWEAALVTEKAHGKEKVGEFAEINWACVRKGGASVGYDLVFLFWELRAAICITTGLAGAGERVLGD